MDPEVVLEFLGDSGSVRSNARDADLRRILTKLEELILTRGSEIDDGLPGDAVQAWLSGDLVDGVAAMQAADPGLSIAAASQRLKEHLGDDPLTKLIERRVDQLRSLGGS